MNWETRIIIIFEVTIDIKFIFKSVNENFRSQNPCFYATLYSSFSFLVLLSSRRVAFRGLTKSPLPLLKLLPETVPGEFENYCPTRIELLDSNLDLKNAVIF